MSDELRDAIAKALAGPGSYLDKADAILALPEYAAELEASYQAGYRSGVEAQIGLERAATPVEVDMRSVTVHDALEAG